MPMARCTVSRNSGFRFARFHLATMLSVDGRLSWEVPNQLCLHLTRRGPCERLVAILYECIMIFIIYTTLGRVALFVLCMLNFSRKNTLSRQHLEKIVCVCHPYVSVNPFERDDRIKLNCTKVPISNSCVYLSHRHIILHL